MACSKSDLIYFLAGQTAKYGGHVKTCSVCRERGESFEIQFIVNAVREVEEARRGAVIGNGYVVGDVLGAGAFGIVVRATGKDKTDVAIKLMRPPYDKDKDMLARFEREAKILAGLRSRRICRSVASGTTKNGRQFIVTEFLRGQTLRDRLSGGTLSNDLAAKLMTQVCEGLGEAHANGVVHRDLKPDNMFVVDANGLEEIKLLDFGIARARHETNVRLTGSGHTMGSPLYMAPEQLMSPKDVGPSADIWAIGIILQELVTGSTPFHGPTTHVISSRILDGLRDPLEGVGAPLEQIIDRCLQHHAENRYASVTELVVALAPHTVARPPASPRPRSSRNRDPQFAETPAHPATAPTDLAVRIVVANPSVAVTEPPDPIVSTESADRRDATVPDATMPDATRPMLQPKVSTVAPSLAKAPSHWKLYASVAVAGALVGALWIAMTNTGASATPDAAMIAAIDGRMTVEPIERDSGSAVTVIVDNAEAGIPPTDAQPEVPTDAKPVMVRGTSEVLTDIQEKAGLAAVKWRTDACFKLHGSTVTPQGYLRARLDVRVDGMVESVNVTVDDECDEVTCLVNPDKPGCCAGGKRKRGRPAKPNVSPAFIECMREALSRARFPRTTEGVYVEKSFEVGKPTAAAIDPLPTSKNAPEPESKSSGEGTLRLGSKPPCQIFIDGKDTGLRTPQHEIKLPVGKHKITLINNEYRIKETFIVNIAVGQPTLHIEDFSDRLPKQPDPPTTEPGEIEMEN